MRELDLEKFWEADEKAHNDNCFSKQSPQVALGIRMSDECVFAELGVEGKPWGDTPIELRKKLNVQYNDIAQKIVGKRLLKETFITEDEKFPDYKQIGEVFGGKYINDGNTTWLESNIKTEKELETLLDNVDKINLHDYILPKNWQQRKMHIFNEYGKKPCQFMSVRGPVTLATSIFGVENLIFLMYDYPDLAKRFFESINKVILEYINIFIEESGNTTKTFEHGFNFYDDDCSLLTSDLYETYALPVLKSVFDFTSPNETDTRFQHSDSAMAHLLPLLSTLNLTGCNFGPTLTIDEIRSHMPKTRIDGQIAPFTFMSNDEKLITSEVMRDCNMAKHNNLKGVNIYTAGSINNGSLLKSMRLVMQIIQNYGQYDN